MGAKLAVADTASLARTCRRFSSLLGGFLLHKGMAVSAQPLSWAREHDDVDLARRVLDEDDRRSTAAEKQWKAHYEATLLVACERGGAAVAKLLMDSLPSTDLDAVVTDNGHWPSWLAATYDQVDVLKVLLDSGRVNVDKQDEYGQTSLRMAVECNCPSSARLLLAAGADTVLHDLDGATPPQVAACHGLSELIGIFAAHEPSSIRDATTGGGGLLAPVHCAAMLGSVEGLRALASHGVDLTMEDYQGDTPLAYAVDKEHVKAIAFLLRQPAVRRSVDEPNQRGVSLLHHAVDAGLGTETVEALLRGGADPNAREPFGGLSVLGVAMQGSRYETVPVLVAHGADPAQRLRDVDVAHLDRGSTPLAMAAAAGRDEALRQMLEQFPTALGSATDAMNVSDADCSPLALAIRNDRMEIVKTLVRHGVDVNVVYTVDEDKMVGLAAEEEARVRGPALFLAIEYSRMECLGLLLKADSVDLGVKDAKGRSLVVAARERGEMEMEAMLRAAGCVCI